MSAGLATTVLPHSSAGPSLLHSSVVGKFQGTIAATTPERPAQHAAVDARVEPVHVHGADLLGQARVVLERLGRLVQLDLRLADRLALLGHEQRDELVDVGLERLARRRAGPGRGRRIRGAPIRARRAAGAADGGVDGARPSAVVDVADQLAGAGVGDRQHVALDRQRHPVDERTRRRTVVVVVVAVMRRRTPACASRANAVSPSSASWDLNSRSISLGLEREPVLERQLAPSCTQRLIAAWASAGPVANRRASDSTCSAASADSNTRADEAHAEAPRRARTSRPVISSSIARAGPISRVRRWVPPLPGSSPSVTSGVPSL